MGMPCDYSGTEKIGQAECTDYLYQFLWEYCMPAAWLNGRKHEE